MNQFFKWLSSDPMASKVLVIIIVFVAIAWIVIYIVAFLQGREISFWPPKIGLKPENLKNKDNLITGNEREAPVIFNPNSEPGNLVEQQRFMLENTGIVKVFENLLNCKEDMQFEFEKARNVSLLLQIGRREMGDGVSSYFYSLAKKKIQPGTSIRILRASKNSPFLSKNRAQRRGRTTYDDWQGELNHLHEIINRLEKSYHVCVEERQHQEPFLWRIFIFDDVAYVSAYLDSTRNDNTALVYKFQKGDKSLYAIFVKYFEYLWKKYAPNQNMNLDEYWVDWE